MAYVFGQFFVVKNILNDLHIVLHFRSYELFKILSRFAFEILILRAFGLLGFSFNCFNILISECTCLIHCCLHLLKVVCSNRELLIDLNFGFLVVIKLESENVGCCQK